MYIKRLDILYAVDFSASDSVSRSRHAYITRHLLVHIDLLKGPCFNRAL